MIFKLSTRLLPFLLLSLFVAPSSAVHGQDKLKKMPGYEQYQRMSSQRFNSVKRISPFIDWSADGKTFTYIDDSKKHTFDVGLKKVIQTEDHTAPIRSRFYRGDRPERGRQYASALSPNQKFKAFTKDRNMYISTPGGSDTIAITDDGNDKNQVKYGIATWVYGEELDQNTAMWWSPDSKKIAFYRFDEKEAIKYYVLYHQTKLQDSVEIEAYPKVGAKNLPVDLLVYDLETKTTITLDTRDGKPFSDGPIGTYLYDISWSPDGKELLFHSTNRKQDIMEFKAANPITGKTRVVVREEWPASFTENSPEFYPLKDNKHFIWASERSGYRNYYLYNFDGKLVHQITNHDFEVRRIVQVDEPKKLLYYMTASGDNHMKHQLHRVRWDGKNNIRLTNPAFHHNVILSPTGKYFVDIAQTHNTPPVMHLVNDKGKVVSEILKADLLKFNELGFKTVERFQFTSADGVTQLDGLIHFPSNFDPSKKYPLILSNYGGPSTNAFTENFTLPNPITEFGFLVVNIDGRNVGGRGKKMLDKLYGNLGIVEMDDFAAGIKSLYDRPYFDKTKVGVYGTSYGGTVAAMSLLRFPEIYHAAVANSAVTDWRNYDNIYTERYMNLIENNKKGYDASNLMNYADNLQGELMIFFGTNDNNVHPANSLQLIQALQKAGKSFEVQVGPDQGHTALNFDRMMEFFIQHLIQN